MKVSLPKNMYVDNKALLACLETYHEEKKARAEAGLPEPQKPEFAGKCIIDVCERLSTRWNFVNYTYRDELVGEAITNCTLAIDCFDPKKSRYPFTYLTIVAFRAMVRTILREKKQNYIKHKNMARIEIDMMDAIREIGALDGSTNLQQAREAHYHVIDSFEQSLKDRKDGNKKNKGMFGYKNTRKPPKDKGRGRKKNKEEIVFGGFQKEEKKRRQMPALAEVG